MEMWLVETPAQADAISKGWVLPGGAAMAPRPEKAHIVGTVTFSRSDEYESLAAYRANSGNFRIAKDGHYDWDGKGERHAWRVSAVRRLAHPVPQPWGEEHSWLHQKLSLHREFCSDDQHRWPSSWRWCLCSRAITEGGS